MADLATLTIESFGGHVGEPFRLAGADGEVDVVLADAQSLGPPPAPEVRAPFSLVFAGPPQPIFPQGTYRLEHPELPALELFVVPVTPGADGARYQVIFS
jgi:hypothetical protein